MLGKLVTFIQGKVSVILENLFYCKMVKQYPTMDQYLYLYLELVPLSTYFLLLTLTYHER